MWKIDHNNLSTGLKLVHSSFNKSERIWGIGKLNSVRNARWFIHAHTHTYTGDHSIIFCQWQILNRSSVIQKCFYIYKKKLWEIHTLYLSKCDDVANGFLRKNTQYSPNLIFHKLQSK